MKRAALLLMALLMGACAPAVQRPVDPTSTFSGPRLEADDFVSFDGARLGLSHWDVVTGEPWAVIVGVHGFDDYANAFHLAASYWAGQGIATYAYDQRGFGRSPHRRVWGGDRLFTEDLRTLTALIRARYPHAIVAVAGESFGGAVAIEAFASDRPPDADRLILLAPAVWGWSSQPLPYALALEAGAHVAPGAVLRLPTFVREHIPSSDNKEELSARGKDPLMTWGVRVDALYGLVSTMQRANDQIGRVRAPTLYLLGAHDEVIPRAPALSAVRRLPAGDRTAYYANGWHLLLRDKQAMNVWQDIAAFIRDPTAAHPSGAPAIARGPDAVHTGRTRPLRSSCQPADQACLTGGGAPKAGA